MHFCVFDLLVHNWLFFDRAVVFPPLWGGGVEIERVLCHPFYSRSPWKATCLSIHAGNDVQLYVVFGGKAQPVLDRLMNKNSFSRRSLLQISQSLW